MLRFNYFFAERAYQGVILGDFRCNLSELLAYASVQIFLFPELGQDFVILDERIIYLKLFESLAVLQIVSCLACLELYTAKSFFDFTQNISEPEQVLFRSFEFTECFFFMRFIFTYTGGFLENKSPVGLSKYKAHKKCFCPYACIHEQLADIFKPAYFAVYSVFAFAALIDFPCYLHLITVNFKLTFSHAFGI